MNESCIIAYPIEAQEIVVAGERRTYVIHDQDLSVMLNAGSDMPGVDRIPTNDTTGLLVLSLTVDGGINDEVRYETGLDVEPLAVLEHGIAALTAARDGLLRVSGA
jgi:hypothetical protein